MSCELFLSNLTHTSPSISHSHNYAADYPNAPLELNLTRAPDTTSVGVRWTAPPVSNVAFVYTPLDGYIVQTRIERNLPEFNDLMELENDITEVNITELHPGTEYDVRVVAINMAGGTPSEIITFTTIPDGKPGKKPICVVYHSSKVLMSTAVSQYIVAVNAMVVGDIKFYLRQLLL